MMREVFSGSLQNPIVTAERNSTDTSRSQKFLGHPTAASRTLELNLRNGSRCDSPARSSPYPAITPATAARFSGASSPAVQLGEYRPLFQTSVTSAGRLSQDKVTAALYFLAVLDSYECRGPEQTRPKFRKQIHELRQHRQEHHQSHAGRDCQCELLNVHIILMFAP